MRCGDRGAIIHESRDIIGVTDVVCPILIGDGRAVACVTVAAVSRRSAAPNFQAMLARLKAACAEIARELGASRHGSSLSPTTMRSRGVARQQFGTCRGDQDIVDDASAKTFRADENRWLDRDHHSCPQDVRTAADHVQRFGPARREAGTQPVSRRVDAMRLQPGLADDGAAPPRAARSPARRRRSWRS